MAEELAEETEGQFRDMRCANCGHESTSHGSYSGQCFGCPIERRCVNFIARKTGPKLRVVKPVKVTVIETKRLGGRK